MSKSFETIEEKLEAYKKEDDDFTYKIENDILSVVCNTYETTIYFINLISNHVNSFSTIEISDSGCLLLRLSFNNDIIYILLNTSRNMHKYINAFCKYYPVFIYAPYYCESDITLMDNCIYFNTHLLSNNIKVLFESCKQQHIFNIINLLHHPNIYLPNYCSNLYPELYNAISDEEWDIFQQLNK